MTTPSYITSERTALDLGQGADADVVVWNGTNSNTIDPTAIPLGSTSSQLNDNSCTSRGFCRSAGYNASPLHAYRTLVEKGP
jgi:hypothetical protein